MSNHVTDEERYIRIKRVLELISSGMSFRECADYLTQNEFSISHVTVRDYINRAKQMNLELYDRCEQVVKDNTPKTIEDESVQQRAKKVCQLLKEGFTIEEIAKALDGEAPVTPMIVYRDLLRVQSLDVETLANLGLTLEDIETIKNSMTEKSLNNLKNRKK